MIILFLHQNQFSSTFSQLKEPGFTGGSGNLQSGSAEMPAYFICEVLSAWYLETKFIAHQRLHFWTSGVAKRAITAHVHAPVDVEGVARDVAGVRGGQEHHRGGDLFDRRRHATPGPRDTLPRQLFPSPYRQLSAAKMAEQGGGELPMGPIIYRPECLVNNSLYNNSLLAFESNSRIVGMFGRFYMPGCFLDTRSGLSSLSWLEGKHSFHKAPPPPALPVAGRMCVSVCSVEPGPRHDEMVPLRRVHAGQLHRKVGIG